MMYLRDIQHMTIQFLLIISGNSTMTDVNIPGLIAIIIFYLIIVAFGVWAARRRKNSEEETMLAGRSIGLIIGTFTMTATWVGGGYINGTAEAVFDKDRGLVWAQAPWGYSISLAIGGFAFAKIMRNREYFTMIDPFQERYGPRMGGILYIPALLGDIFWSAAILNALGATISVIINVGRVPSIIASSFVAVFYTLIGGLYAVTYTDIIQLSCIFIGLWISVPFAITNDAVSSISANSGEAWTGEIQTTKLGIWIDYGLLLIFGGIPWQAYFQRVLSCKTARKAQGLSIAASIGCIVLAIPAVIIGAIGASTDWKKTAFYSGVPTNDTVTFEKAMILPMVLQYLCPPVVSFIGLGAVSAAVMSSADSSILSASTICARNVYKLVFRQKASEKEVIWVMRISMVLVGATATVIALLVNSIYTLFALCSDLVYVILFPQLCSVIHIPDANIYGSIMGYIMGLILRVGGGESAIGFPALIKYPYYDEENKEQLFPFKTLSMIVSFLTIISVSYLTKYLFTKGILLEKYDFLYYFKRYEVDKTYAKENENYEMDRQGMLLGETPGV